MKRGKNINISIVILFLFIPKSYCQTILFQHNLKSGEALKIASHRGDNILLERELNINSSGKSVFYFDSLKSGIYYLIFPDSSSFEFMYDDKYPGKIIIEQTNNNPTKVLSAPLSTLKFDEYVKYIDYVSVIFDSLNKELKQSKIKTKEKKKLNFLYKEFSNKKDSLINALTLEFKDDLLGAYIKAQQKIVVPDYEASSKKTNKDSTNWMWRLEYYNKHFLDNLDISDERLINTPVYTSMINRYLDKITLQEPSEIKNAVDFVLSKASNSNETSMFLSGYLLNKYSLRKNDATYETIYLHIIKNYYLGMQPKWVSLNDIQILTNEYNKRKPLELGQPAPNIIMATLAGKDTSLVSINSEYTILYFYNYDCDLCQKVTPRINYISEKYDSDFTNIFAVCLGKEDKKCEKYIDKNKLNAWCNVIDFERSNNVANMYNLKYTPAIFVLGKKKEILLKNITIDILEDFFKSKAGY